MITQEQIEKQGERVKALADTIENLAVSYHEEIDKLKKMIVTWKLQTLAYGEEAKFVMNTQAPLQAPLLQVLTSPVETAKSSHSSDLGRVRAMLTARGFSSGSYAVLAESETRYQIEISSDSAKSMKYWISKARCEKVQTVVEAKAA